jgi:hypothetical protein
VISSRSGRCDALLLLASLAACDAPGPGGAHVSAEPDRGPGEPTVEIAAHLAAYEQARHQSYDPIAATPWSASAGDEPFAIAALDDAHAVGVLRGRDALVLLAADGREQARVAVADDPVAVVVDAKRMIHVLASGGELTSVRASGDELGTPTRVRVPDLERGRDLALVPSGLLVADALGDRVLGVPMVGGAMRGTTKLTDCGGPIDLDHDAGLVAAVCLFDRGLALAELDAAGKRTVRSGRVVHEGPWWSVDVAPHDGGWIVAGGGVEDHALDRTNGFGFVDPYVFVVHVTRCGTELCTRRIAAINVGEHGVVMPKWVDLAMETDRARLVVAGAGGETMIQLEVGLDGHVGTPTPIAVAPGLRQLARIGDGWLGANPLLDAWVRIDDDGDHRLAYPPGESRVRDVDVRVGEALFFTTLLTPGGESTGMRSRFTCETCHFEGTVDGRVHFTGREDIHAATKPLLGLFVNRPHFSRALDRTLAVMVDNEFAVANKGGSQVDAEARAQFSVSPEQTPWVAELGVDAPLQPEALRRAFMAFFVAFDHEPSPRVQARTGLSMLEQRGAELFATHCESCHQARTVTDDARTRTDAAKWPALVLSPRGPLVWASETRVRTGILPYVHPEGARVTSLRRLWLKRPYFTNGSARTLDDVLSRVRLRPDFAHAGGDAGSGLDADARRALHAFLVLL